MAWTSETIFHLIWGALCCASHTLQGTTMLPHLQSLRISSYVRPSEIASATQSLSLGHSLSVGLYSIADPCGSFTAISAQLWTTLESHCAIAGPASQLRFSLCSTPFHFLTILKGRSQGHSQINNLCTDSDATRALGAKA